MLGVGLSNTDSPEFDCLQKHRIFNSAGKLAVLNPPKKDFECLECQKRFCQNQGLAQHVNSVHRKIKSFECPECSHKSLKKSSLISHFKKVHNNKKMECQKRFCQNQGLAQHVNSVHRKIKSFECPECSHKSFKKSRLISHFKKVHNNKKMSYIGYFSNQPMFVVLAQRLPRNSKAPRCKNHSFDISHN